MLSDRGCMDCFMCVCVGGGGGKGGRRGGCTVIEGVWTAGPGSSCVHMCVCVAASAGNRTSVAGHVEEQAGKDLCTATPNL